MGGPSGAAKKQPKWGHFYKLQRKEPGAGKAGTALFPGGVPHWGNSVGRRAVERSARHGQHSCQASPSCSDMQTACGLPIHPQLAAARPDSARAAQRRTGPETWKRACSRDAQRAGDRTLGRLYPHRTVQAELECCWSGCLARGCEAGCSNKRRASPQRSPRAGRGCWQRGGRGHSSALHGPSRAAAERGRHLPLQQLQASTTASSPWPAGTCLGDVGLASQ